MNTDYPRMLFHRTKDPVTVQSREEEEELGGAWSRKIWPPGPQTPDPVEEPPEVEPEPEPETEPDEEVAPAPHRRPGRPPSRAKVAHKKR